MRKARAGIGIDVGGTYTKVVVVGPTGRLLRSSQVETAPRMGPKAFVRRLAEMIRALGPGDVRVAAAGVGLAGDVDSWRGALRFTPNLRRFTGFDFKAALEGALGVHVEVDNDANMAAWGGYVVELGRKPAHALCVTLGTGIGGGLILGGRLHRGATGTAGEIGHLCVMPGGEKCHCGLRGCLEAYAGSYGILRTVRRLLSGPGVRRSLLRRMEPDPARLDTRLVALAARKGDPVARAAWAVAGRALGLGIANAVYLLNPEAVLLVGGVSAVGPLLLQPIRDVLRDQPFKRSFGIVRVSVARTPHLGALGAALRGLESAA